MGDGTWGLALRSSIFTLLRRADDGVGDGLPHDAVEAAVEVVAQRAGAPHAEAALLVQTDNLDYNIAHRSKAEKLPSEAGPSGIMQQSAY